MPTGETDRETEDGRQTVTLRFPPDAASLIKMQNINTVIGLVCIT